MLNPTRVAEALEAKRELLLQSQNDRARDVAEARRAYAAFCALDPAAIEDRLSADQWPGARVTLELSTHPNGVVSFPESLASHRQAREWALEALRGRTTIAVDGSQVSLSAELDLPLAAAQVGWYVNPHLESEPHDKDVRLEVLVGDELRQSGTEATRLEVRRFEMEVERCIELMREHAGRQPRPVFFLDDPLVVPFAGEHGTGRREAYVEGISALLEESERLRAPLFGYTPDPSARDLAHMLRSLDLLPHATRVGDALFVGPTLRGWGDRTCVYLCARAGAYLDQYLRADGSSLSDQIAFCYLRATRDGRPARLEFPRWLAEEPSELSQALDVVRAECIIGLGYPYALEAAHDAAVLTGADRARLGRLFGDYCLDAGLRVSTTTKAASKRRRRSGG